MVDPDGPYGSPDAGRDLAGFAGSSDWLAVLRLHVEVMALLVWAMKNAPMVEGPYAIDTGVREAMAVNLRRRIAHFPAEVVARTTEQFPFLSSTEPFIFRREHLLLLRRLDFGWPDRGRGLASIQLWAGLPVLTVDFKRPFGDRTAFALDMAAILGLPHPPPWPARPEPLPGALPLASRAVAGSAGVRRQR
jgi:hypothetical protein